MSIRKPSLSVVLWLVVASACVADETEQLFPDVIKVDVPHISTDKSVEYDYDIVYVRAPRAGDTVHKRFYLDFSSPVVMEPGADLMLLHPDGSEELLVAGGAGSITDPVVSLFGLDPIWEVAATRGAPRAPHCLAPTPGNSIIFSPRLAEREI